MSIQSEIDRLKGNVSASYSAVQEMGGTVPENANSDNLPGAIRSIQGTSGQGGNPIGTIISYLGIVAPKDHLICDGTAYNITAYPKLAEFFKIQFGASNYFGGDGTVTFAVPDMRNLFLR